MVRILDSFKKIIPDKTFLKIQYRHHFKKKLNLENPKTFNEKLQWLKLNDRKKEYIKYVDKYEVREHIEKEIGKEYLIPLLGVYEKPEEIDWSTLPGQFVIKCTHGSSSNIVCKDKSKLNIEKAKIELDSWMNRNWYWYGREWAYKDVKPRIVIEKYMANEDNKELVDYKFFAFDGVPKIMNVSVGAGKGKSDSMTYYLLDGSGRTFYRQGYEKYQDELVNDEMINEMISLSKRLSKGISFLRVDFYIVKNTIYFGELTLSPASGYNKFKPEFWDERMGEMLELPKM